MILSVGVYWSPLEFPFNVPFATAAGLLSMWTCNALSLGDMGLDLRDDWPLDEGLERLEVILGLFNVWIMRAFFNSSGNACLKS